MHRWAKTFYKRLLEMDAEEDLAERSVQFYATWSEGNHVLTGVVTIDRECNRWTFTNDEGTSWPTDSTECVLHGRIDVLEST